MMRPRQRRMVTASDRHLHREGDPGVASIANGQANRPPPTQLAASAVETSRHPAPRLGRAMLASAVLAATAAANLARAEDPAATAATAVPLGVSRRAERFSQLRQSVAVRPEGGFAAVWEDGELPTRGVRLQYIAPDGSPVFSDGGLELAARTGDHTEPVLTPHASSGVLVAFGRGDGYGSTEILVQWVDGDGIERWAPGGVSVFGGIRTAQRWSNPTLQEASDGGVFICAVQTIIEPLPVIWDPIVCQRLGNDGARLWGETGVAAGGQDGWRVLPRIVADGRGGLFVFWLNKGRLFDDEVDAVLVEGQRLGGDGTPIWGRAGKLVHRTRIAEQDAYTYNELAAVSAGRSGAIIAFGDWNGQGQPSYDVFVQRVSASGARQWGNGATVAAGLAPQTPDSLAPAPDGGAFVTVFETINPARSRLRAFRVLPAGAHAWGGAGRLIAGPRATGLDFASFATMDGNRLRIAWTHQQTPSTPTFDVYWTAYTPSGKRLTAASGLPLYRRPGSQFVRGYAFDARRGAGLVVFDHVPLAPRSDDTLAIATQ